MIWLSTYLPLMGAAALACGFACAQYIAMRAGVFSVATAGFASIGAYTAAILSAHLGVHPIIALFASLLIGMLFGALLSIPLARLRGVFQAIATMAFVQIVMSLMLFFDSFTGGAMGINGIPQVVGVPHLVIFVAVLVFYLWLIGRTSIGCAFDTVRQDETVAVSLGISVTRYHALAFILSGGIAGLTGGLYAFHFHSIVPEQFGFPLLVATLGSVVLGGRISVLGPIVGAVLFTVIPEFARPLAEQRYLLHGALLMVAIIYMPNGIVDTLKYQMARRSALQSSSKLQGKGHAASLGR